MPCSRGSKTPTCSRIPRYSHSSITAIYETAGFVGNVIFPVATVSDSATGRIAIYYGCADTVVGVAYTQVDELIAYIKANA